jgi:hypothetical protein
MSKTVDLKPFEQKNANSQLLKILLKSANFIRNENMVEIFKSYVDWFQSIYFH